MNRNVVIRLSEDEYVNDDCEWVYDQYGIEMWVDGTKMINNVAIASLYGNGSQCYTTIDQFNLIAGALAIPRSAFYHTEEKLRSMHYSDPQIDDYYCDLDTRSQFESIIEQVLPKHGYNVEFVDFYE